MFCLAYNEKSELERNIGFRLYGHPKAILSIPELAVLNGFGGLVLHEAYVSLLVSDIKGERGSLPSSQALLEKNKIRVPSAHGCKTRPDVSQAILRLSQIRRGAKWTP